VAKLSKQRDDIDAAIADLSGFINELETLELPVKRS
jgi:hypothetical protein